MLQFYNMSFSMYDPVWALLTNEKLLGHYKKRPFGHINSTLLD